MRISAGDVRNVVVCVVVVLVHHHVHNHVIYKNHDRINKKIEITLTDRTNMEFHMLVGRKALGKRWLVDPSKSSTLS